MNCEFLATINSYKMLVGGLWSKLIRKYLCAQSHFGELYTCAKTQVEKHNKQIIQIILKLIITFVINLDMIIAK